MAAVRYYKPPRRALPIHRRPGRPIDNSPTEREFQNVAKLRLNMLFAGSTEGAHRACVLLGIVATCRAIGVPVQAYLPGPSSDSAPTATCSAAELVST
jgi:transposase